MQVLVNPLHLDHFSIQSGEEEAQFFASLPNQITNCNTAKLLITEVHSRTERGSDAQVSSIREQAATFSPPTLGLPQLPSPGLQGGSGTLPNPPDFPG